MVKIWTETFLQSQDGKKKSALAEMFGVDDLSDHGGSTIVHHTNNQGGISSSEDIVPLNTDQPDSPRAKRRGSQCGTPPSGSGFSHWKVRSHSSPDRFTGQRSLGESTSGEFMDKSTGQLCSTGPGGPEHSSPDRLTGPLSTGKDRTGQKSPTKSTEPDRTGRNWVSISRRVHRSRDRIGPDRTELGVNLQTSPPVTGQSSYLPVKGR